MPAAGHRRSAEPRHRALECIDHRGDGGVADDVEAGRHTGLGAGGQMVVDGVVVQVSDAGAVGSIRVGVAQPGGARAERTVDEQITRESAGAGFGQQCAGLRGGGHRLAPVADHLDTVGGVAQFLPVLCAADIGSRALVDRDDAGRGGGIQGRPAGVGALRDGEQAARFGADEVVGGCRQRPLRVEAGGRRQARHPPAQRTGGRRGVHVYSGQIHGDPAHHGVEIGGARRLCDTVRGPVRVVPAVPPHRLPGMRGDVCGKQSQQMLKAGGLGEVKAGDPQAGGGDVDVAVDERRCYESPVQIDGLGIRELSPADRVATQPGDHAVAHRHRSGVRVRRAVHQPVQQKCGHRVSVTVQRTIGRLPPP